ncbi:hypothetical protein DPMN_015173 [Dreissena polymorpha]|uniref:Uncharacterized protein n=1 Tax=Dreissena polymorpha TaxID=45954 RepID=A0A9D4NC63_DREPO|nr:hypothetical protein DPMN_015173 [Dreissena polymorpha]
MYFTIAYEEGWGKQRSGGCSTKRPTGSPWGSDGDHGLEGVALAYGYCRCGPETTSPERSHGMSAHRCSREDAG